MNIWKITIKIHPKIFLISLPRHSRNRKDFWKIERLLHEKKIRLLINQTRLGNLFGSPTWREKMEKFGYENAATFKVLPTWPFSSLFSWMDRRKRITEGESLDTALPQLATASDRWTTQLDIARQSYRRNFYPWRICFRTCVSVWMDPCIELCNIDEFDDTQMYLLFKFFFKYHSFIFLFFKVPR